MAQETRAINTENAQTRPALGLRTWTVHHTLLHRGRSTRTVLCWRVRNLQSRCRSALTIGTMNPLENTPESAAFCAQDTGSVHPSVKRPDKVVEYVGTFVERCEEALVDLQKWLGMARYNSVADYLTLCLLRADSFGQALHITRFTLNSVRFLSGAHGFPVRALLHECCARVRHLRLRKSVKV